jgi:predicted MPP superfamily phosphohydrolase
MKNKFPVSLPFRCLKTNKVIYGKYQTIASCDTMFLLIVLVIYTLPNIYVYFRIKKLFTDDGHKKIYTVIYILFASAFPMAEVLSHNISQGWVQYFLVIAFYSLPFFLYLFLFVVLFDIFRGLNRLLKIVPVEVIHGRKFRLTVLRVLFVFPVIIVIIGSVHLQTIRVNEYHVDVPRKSAVIKHLKIAAASDFHLGQMSRKRFLEKFTARINSLNPDIVLIPGDIVEGHRDDGDMTEFARLFRQIKSKYGVYASLGNHESHGRRSKLRFFADAGIDVLADTFVVIDNSFCLVGRNDRHSNNRKPMAELLENIPGHLPVIVLDHRPTGLEQVSKHGVDIQLSGHTHNGQLFPLNYIINSLYELGWGYKKIRDTHFFVTSGIQVWGPPVRTAGDSEIMVIKVDFK